MAFDEEAAKRNFSRVPLSRIVRYRAADTATFRSAQVTNISMGGMYIHSDVTFPLGTRVYLQFMLESGDIVAEGWAHVVRDDGAQSGMGLEFVSIDEKFMAFTQLVVSEQLIQDRLPR